MPSWSHFLSTFLPGRPLTQRLAFIQIITFVFHKLLNPTCLHSFNAVLARHTGREPFDLRGRVFDHQFKAFLVLLLLLLLLSPPLCSAPFSGNTKRPTFGLDDGIRKDERTCGPETLGTQQKRALRRFEQNFRQSSSHAVRSNATSWLTDANQTTSGSEFDQIFGQDFVCHFFVGFSHLNSLKSLHMINLLEKYCFQNKFTSVRFARTHSQLWTLYIHLCVCVSFFISSSAPFSIQTHTRISVSSTSTDFFSDLFASCVHFRFDWRSFYDQSFPLVKKQT